MLCFIFLSLSHLINNTQQDVLETHVCPKEHQHTEGFSAAFSRPLTLACAATNNSYNSSW